jgi:hypothetical protein
MQGLRVELIRGFGRHELHCRPLHRLGRHGVLLVWAPLTSLSLVGQEHGRTIPLADIQIRRQQGPLVGMKQTYVTREALILPGVVLKRR